MEETLVIHRLFSQTVSNFPDHVALQNKKDNQWLKLTYKDLESSSKKIATYLIQSGFKKGDFAMIILENRPEWPKIYLGIMYAGLIAVPLDPQLSLGEIKNLITDSQAKLIFCSYDIFISKLSSVVKDPLIKLVVLGLKDKQDKEAIDFSDDIEAILPETNLLPDVAPEDSASLFYTSGTTANPKGVLLTHQNLGSNFRSIAKLNICLASDNFLSILPLHHTYSLMVTLIVPLLIGAKITYFTGFKPQDLAQVIKEAEVTVLAGVPQFYVLFHKALFERIRKIPALFLPFILPFIKPRLHNQFKSLRLLVSGGARLEPKIGRDLFKLLGIKFIEGYGLTETSPVVTLNPAQKLRFGSVGKPIPEVQIKINNPDKSGIGEVLIKGPNVMQGYFKQPELTLEVLKEGWFYSGDLGYLDKEGYLYLVGREKEVIVLSSGKNIYPEELEEYYRQSPYIRELCILSKEEERFGRLMESLHAIIVPNLEYFQQRNESDIRGKIRWELENLAKALPPYKHIMGFSIIKEELPRTALKKIKRYEVRERYQEEKFSLPKAKEAVFSEADRKLLNLALVQKIIKYISGELNKPVYLDSHLEIDLGIDSLSRVELGLGIEALLNIKIHDEALYTASTVKEVIINILDIVNKIKPVMVETEVAQMNWAQLLKQLPPETLLKKIRLEPHLLDRLLTRLFKGIFLFIFRTFWFLRIEGRENLLSEGPYLICANHASYLDGFVIFSSLPFKNAINAFFVGYSNIFEQPLVSWTTQIARLISIDLNRHLTEAMQVVSYALNNKKIVCIFPEGRRSVDENVGEFKKGVGILLAELAMPVIPVYIKGSHYSWPRGNRLPRFYPLKLTFGKALYLKQWLKEGETKSYETIAEKLRAEVLKLRC